MTEFNAETARENMILAPSEEFDTIIKEIERASKLGAGNLVTSESLVQTTINKLTRRGFEVKYVATEPSYIGSGIRYFIRWDREQSTKNNLPDRTIGNHNS